MIDRLVHRIYRAMGAAVRPLSLETCCRTGAVLGKLSYYFFPGYRRLAVHNLQIAFGLEKTPAQIRSLAQEHFCALGANLLAGLKIAGLPADAVRAIVTIEGEEILRATIGAGKGFVGVISHLGNWELLSQISPLIFGCPGGAIYQRLGNPFMDAEVRESRARLGVKLFERKEGFQAAMQMLRAGGAVGVLVDQHAGDAGVWCPFFGRLASTSPLAATLALRTGAALLPMAVFSNGPGRWRMVIEVPVEPAAKGPDAITAQLNRTLEQQIRRQPADWFWVHNRWKTPRPKFLLATYKRGVVTGSQENRQFFRIAIRTSNWLGDAVMNAPAVRAIKNGRPDAHITIITPQKLTGFWRSLSEVDEVLEITPGEHIFAVAAKIRAGRFDAAVVFPNSLRTALEVYLGGVPRRVGFPGHRRSALLNQVFKPKKKPPGGQRSAVAGDSPGGQRSAVAGDSPGGQRSAVAGYKGATAERCPPLQPTHQVYHYLALAEFIGADIDSPQTMTQPRPARPDRAPVIGLCAGAEYGGAKRWLPERFAEVMQVLHSRHGCGWKLFGIAKDRVITDEILQKAQTPAEDLVGKTTLGELIAGLRSCDLLLTNDTGTMHLAAVLGVPVVAIFGSTDPSLTGPLGSGHQVLREPVDCSPCFLRECPIDFRCMKAISVGQVVDAVETLLSGHHVPTATLPQGMEEMPLNEN